MTTTTIRVTKQARDDLVAVAQARQLSVSKLVELEAHRMRRDAWYAAVRSAGTDVWDDQDVWENTDDLP